MLASPTHKVVVKYQSTSTLNKLIYVMGVDYSQLPTARQKTVVLFSLWQMSIVQ